MELGGNLSKPGRGNQPNMGRTENKHETCFWPSRHQRNSVREIPENPAGKSDGGNLLGRIPVNQSRSTIRRQCILAQFRDGLHPEVKRHLVMSETPATVLVDYATAAIKTDSHLCNLGVISRRPTASPEVRFHVHTREPLAAPPGDPMDLDTTRRFKFTQRTPNRFPRRTNAEDCYNCGKKEHFATECPQPKKIRHSGKKPFRVAEATYEGNPEDEETQEEELSGNDGPQEQAIATATRGRNQLQKMKIRPTGLEQPGTTARKKS